MEGRMAEDERTLGQLVSDASEDLSALVRYEVALAKAEIKADVRRGAIGGALFAVVAVLGLFALITLVIAGGYGLVAAGFGPAVAFLIVTGVLLLIALVLALIAIFQFKRIKPPERTIASTKLTLAAVRGRKGA